METVRVWVDASDKSEKIKHSVDVGYQLLDEQQDQEQFILVFIRQKKPAASFKRSGS